MERGAGGLVFKNPIPTWLLSKGKFLFLAINRATGETTFVVKSVGGNSANWAILYSDFLFTAIGETTKSVVEYSVS